jgi:hypothetical protein
MRNVVRRAVLYGAVAVGSPVLLAAAPAAADLTFTVDTTAYMAGAGIILAALGTMWGVKKLLGLITGR